MSGKIAVVASEAYDVIAGKLPPEVELRRLEGRAALEGAQFVVPGSDDAVAVEELVRAPDLQVLQALSAGTDWIEDLVPRHVTLCNARGSRDAAVAEWVVGALLGVTTGLLGAARDRGTERWQPAELGGATVLVLGMGSIGAAVAARLAPFGVDVVGVASTARPGVHGVDELHALLARADFLVVLTPLTDATEGLVGAAVLAALPDGAVVLNAGRGAVVDTDALTAEVRAGRLRTVLDVVEPEPLPKDHPLWPAPGTLAITPHVAGDTSAALARASHFAADQLGRWVRGEPLDAVVRPGGYSGVT